MIALLLALAALSPAPVPDSDQRRWERELLCWEVGNPASCRPRVVRLADDWDPRPAEKDWPR